MLRFSRANITYALGVIIIFYMLLLTRFHVHVEEHHAADARRAEPPTPVSYTHLTLPTICSV